mmetsp:Transcript_15968/g.28771  ORF Transcript_15968/g.28771 Transcript_15968/m.28771 type:complete len:454 (-) Transcript_15968:81-1442(-)
MVNMNTYSAIILVGLLAVTSLPAASARYLVGNRISPTLDGGNDHSVENPPALDNESEPPFDIKLHSTDHHLPKSLIAAQFARDPHAHRDRLEMIQTGELGLTGIRYSPTSFSAESDDNDMYSNVYGEFCVFNSQLNKADPSYYPTLKGILSESPHCSEHRYTIPLGDAIEAIKTSKDMKTLPLSGMLFHQGFAGAGIVSNALTAFDSTLVISEHSALQDALSACDAIHNRFKSDDCSIAKQQRLVRDIVTLFSRTSDDSVKNLFLKLNSSSAVYLHTLRALYPSAKWTFSYRNAEETLSKNMQRKRNITCVKAKRNPSAALSEKSTEYNLELEYLSHHEICALHLSTLFEAAMREHESSSTGLLISYSDIVSSLGNVIVEEVLPYLGLQGELNSNSEVRDKIIQILSTRSNSRSAGRTKQWDATQESDLEISDEVSNAVIGFMGDMVGGPSAR